MVSPEVGNLGRLKELELDIRYRKGGFTRQDQLELLLQRLGRAEAEVGSHLVGLALGGDPV